MVNKIKEGLSILGVLLIAAAVLLATLFAANALGIICEDACHRERQLENLHNAVVECAERGVYTLQECKVVVPQILGGAE
jgi:hypothetical protein